MTFRALFMTTVLLALPATAQASDPRLVGTFGDWATYSRTVGNEKICYVLAKPKALAPRNVRHGDVYFMVANWKSGKAKEQPSLLTGFPLKTNRAPSAKVGRTKVSMYVSQNEAFIESRRNEARLVKSMRAGSTMQVSAVSQRGTNVSYDFSLKGITAALKKAKASCQ